MWMLLPALSLAIVHIAGDNAGVVPDVAVSHGGTVWLVIVLAYFLLGGALTGTVAWVGARAGQEMGVTVGRLFGGHGKRLMALVVLSVSLPASALTGGYYGGWLLSMLTGLPYLAAVLCCLLTFTVLAAGYGEELVVMSNLCSLLLLPLLLSMLPLAGVGNTAVWDGTMPDWRLVLALFGYNAGGMRPALVSEAASWLRKRPGRAVGLAVAAKTVEGLFTMVMAYVVLAVGANGPLALAQAATSLFGRAGGWLFAFVLLCTFANAMVPAMMVNARQVACLTGLAYWPALVVAAAAVYMASFLTFDAMLAVLAVAGPATAVFVGCVAYRLHKSGDKQQ